MFDTESYRGQPRQVFNGNFSGRAARIMSQPGRNPLSVNVGCRHVTILTALARSRMGCNFIVEDRMAPLQIWDLFVQFRIGLPTLGIKTVRDDGMARRAHRGAENMVATRRCVIDVSLHRHDSRIGMGTVDLLFGVQNKSTRK